MKSIIDEAQEIISGPRRKSYGPVEESFRRIALIWSGVLGVQVSDKQVVLMMIGLKTYREAAQNARDNRVDILGYTLLLDQLIDPIETKNAGLYSRK